MKKIPIAISWSGGKDSSLMLYKLLNDVKYEVTSLHTAISEETQRVSMHGVSVDLMQAQAYSIGLPLDLIPLPSDLTNSSYELALGKYYDSLFERGIGHIGFGDIFLEDLKAYRDTLLSRSKLTGVYPLWQKKTPDLATEFLTLGFETIICCSNKSLFKNGICGQTYSQTFLDTFSNEVDPCGENGEFHTFAVNGPIFENKIETIVRDVVTKNYEYKSENGVMIKSAFEFADLALTI